MKSVLRTACAAALAASVALSGPASAATATSSLGVSASVTANCIIDTAAIAFGAYDPVAANAASALAGTGTVNVTCTSGASAKVTLSEGANANTGSTPAAPLRRMLGAATTYLNYALHSDNARTVVWGNDAATGVAHTGTGASTALTVYGSVASGQNVPAGSYSDTVVATVTF